MFCACLNCSPFYIEKRSLTEPETHSFALTGWPASPRHLPGSAFPALGLQICAVFLGL